jgi:hypothetical protein
MPRNFDGGCTGVENDGFAGTYQLSGSTPDSAFLIPVQSFFGTQRVILGCVQAPDGAPMGPDDAPYGRKGVQITTRGHRRNGEQSRQFGHGSLAILAHKI